MEAAYFAGVLQKKRDGTYRSPDECIRMCRDAGYKVIDWSPDYSRDTWQDEIKEAARAAEKYGLEIFQSHTPYNFYKKEPLEKFARDLDASVEAARILGAKNLVFHFDEYHPKEPDKFDAAEAIRIIYDFMAPHIEKTVGYGINAALETILEDRSYRSHYGADYAELCASIDIFNDEKVTCCWDFGHAELSYKEKHIENLIKMGKKITCTHVHDNYYEKDLHLLPYLGNLKWEKLIPALRETGYDGPLTYEGGYGCIPDELTEEYLRYTCHVMQSLCKL
ncbi:MAG: sugar phosphate isomerase/epimerase [Clostridiales bacterium]|nr:sugar phosphate isomerase/epimerase [Clostridiales bacterium]